MSAPNTSIKDILYEPPGPKAKRKIYIATAISLIFVLHSVAFVGAFNSLADLTTV